MLDDPCVGYIELLRWLVGVTYTPMCASVKYDIPRQCALTPDT